MIRLPMVFQAYTPQLQFGDWQIVVFVNRRRNRISVERWHSSEKAYHPLESNGQVLRINTGIRAFRRQMPVLAAALEEIDTSGMSNNDIIDAVFRVLSTVYRADADDEPPAQVDELHEEDFDEFLVQRKKMTLEALSTAAH